MSKISNRELYINEQIRESEIRVVDSDGSQLGVMPTKKALEMAYEKELDLVKIAPKATPPVCRIMDYGKYKFEMTKKEKEAKKKQHVVNLKEIRLSAAIEPHDIGVKAKNADKFLKAGNKIKVSIRFRGREMAHTQIGYQVMKQFIGMLTESMVVERRAKLEGRQMIMIIGPANDK